MKPLHETVDDGTTNDPDRSSRLAVVALGALIFAILSLVIWGIVALASAGDAAYRL